MPSSGRIRKMEGSRDIATHLSNGISKCLVKKYTEYDGTMINAESVGIVFPVHSWGISLAVIAFIRNLRISEKTYVYAVPVGDCMSADVDATASKRKKYLDPVEKQLQKKAHGTNYDMFLRCVDAERAVEDTEIRNRGVKDIVSGIRNILNGLLFVDMDSWELVYNAKQLIKKQKNIMDTVIIDYAEEVTERKSLLSNVYLDDYWTQGVRICQGM